MLLLAFLLLLLLLLLFINHVNYSIAGVLLLFLKSLMNYCLLVIIIACYYY